jgi:hypothetical protein
VAAPWASPGSVPSLTNRAVLPAGTRPSSSWTLSQSSGMKGLLERVRQVRAPARSGDPEHAVLVDPDDGADRGAVGRFEAAEGTIEVGWAETLLDEQGPGLRAARRVEPIARLFQ